jgi:hypothetical protein
LSKAAVDNNVDKDFTRDVLPESTCPKTPTLIFKTSSVVGGDNADGGGGEDEEEDEDIAGAGCGSEGEDSSTASPAVVASVIVAVRPCR